MPGRSDQKRISVAPSSIPQIEHNLEAKLSEASSVLSARERDLEALEQRISEWRRVIEEAKVRRNHRASVSANAQRLTDQLLQDAEDKVSALQARHGPIHDEVARLSEVVSAMSSLKTRLDVQKFREDFITVDDVVEHATPTGLDDSEIVAIGREINTWSHSLDALKELRKTSTAREIQA